MFMVETRTEAADFSHDWCSHMLVGAAEKWSSHSTLAIAAAMDTQEENIFVAVGQLCRSIQ